MSNFIVRRIAALAIAIVPAAACSGCVAGGAAGVAASVVPMVAAGSAQMVGATAGGKEGGGIGGASKDDIDNKCDQLVRVPPGVEEVRKTKDGVIESRQWKVVDTAGGPSWIMVHGKDATGDAWQPKPGITKLFFDPPLYQVLKPDEPQYLAYAPADVVNVADSEQFDSMTSAFGPGVGTFKWHDRRYTYVLVNELPCFKPAKEK